MADTASGSAAVLTACRASVDAAYQIQANRLVALSGCPHWVRAASPDAARAAARAPPASPVQRQPALA